MVLPQPAATSINACVPQKSAQSCADFFVSGCFLFGYFPRA
jgi:hypothetical protein